MKRSARVTLRCDAFYDSGGNHGKDFLFGVSDRFVRFVLGVPPFLPQVYSGSAHLAGKQL